MRTMYCGFDDESLMKAYAAFGLPIEKEFILYERKEMCESKYAFMLSVDVTNYPLKMVELATYMAMRNIAPYDTYGLSRFVVIVDINGRISCYSRYNLSDGRDGFFLNKEQLEELLGVNPKEAFPYIKSEEINENIEVEIAVLTNIDVNSIITELKLEDIINKRKGIFILKNIPSNDKKIILANSTVIIN